MNVESALLQALLDDPGDVTSWLVLADWLDDQGEAASAELVRLRVLLAGPDDPPGREEAEERIRTHILAGAVPCVPRLVNSLGMELALVPAGSFWMGSPRLEHGRDGDEEPFHLVQITRPFFMSIYPVTQEQYLQITGDGPSHFCATGEGASKVAGLDTTRFPVENVSWDDAVGFCERLSNWPAERKAKRVYRLPTEAEWEYSCRAGIRADPYHFGDRLSSQWANIDGNRPSGGARRGPFLDRTCAVGSYLPNAWGLFDLHGNVWEWCHDRHDSRYYARSPACDPQGSPDFAATHRSLRGGAWDCWGINCRTARRLHLPPSARGGEIGFRVVCTAVSEG
jgi:uncharacterized protein (TIGR02996 family)